MSMTVDNLPLFPEPGHRERHGHDYEPGHRGLCGATVLDINGFGRDCGDKPVCAHTWPAELEPDAACLHCGLAYADWSEEDTRE